MRERETEKENERERKTEKERERERRQSNMFLDMVFVDLEKSIIMIVYLEKCYGYA